MDKEQIRAARKTMLAYENGAVIEHRRRGCSSDSWLIVSTPLWNWGNAEYRVKSTNPEYVWVSFYGDGEVEMCVTGNNRGCSRMRRYRFDEIEY